MIGSSVVTDPIRLWAVRVFMGLSNHRLLQSIETPLHTSVRDARGQALVSLVVERTGGLQ
jgi:hypothetical protein